MSQMRMFNFNGSDVSVILIDNNPWWIAKDVCDILEIQNVTQAVQRLDIDERSMLNIGRQGDTNIINEFGLYSLILASRKPEAKAFKRWITHEVIPSIRKTGSYVAQKELSRIQILEMALESERKLLQVEQEKQAVEQEKKVLQIENQCKDEQLKEQAPKVLLAETALLATDCLKMETVAKIISDKFGVECTRNKLIDFLRDRSILQSNKVPYQKYMKYFKVVFSSKTFHGQDNEIITTLVKTSGLTFVIKKWKDVNEERNLFNYLD